MIVFHRALLIAAIAMICSAGSLARAEDKGPSFDCVRALTADERLICSSNNLRYFDLKLAQEYQKSLARVTAAEAAELKRRQRAWVEARNDKCRVAKNTVLTPMTAYPLSRCFLDAYMAQLSVLRAYPAIVPDPVATPIPATAEPPQPEEEIWDRAAADPLAAAQQLRAIDSIRAKFYADILSHAMEDTEADFASFAEGVLDVTGNTEELRFITIPCDLLKKQPRLLALLKGYHFSNRDNFTPRGGCATKNEDLPPAVAQYLATSPDSVVNLLAQECGTMRYGDYRELTIADIRMHHLPQTYLTLEQSDLNWVPRPWPGIDEIPLAKVRAATPVDFVRFQFIEKPAFLRARTALASYFQTEFQLSREDARLAAHRALWEQVRSLQWVDGEYQEVLPPAIVAAIVTNAPIADIATRLHEDMAAAERIGSDATQTLRRAVVMAAAIRPGTLKWLAEQNYKIDVSDDAGKTPLMEAAAIGDARSIKTLLEMGADPNAATAARSAGEILAAWTDNSVCGGWPDMANTNGHQTALMLAAETGSLGAIKALRAGGADKAIADSRGFKAADYLRIRNPDVALAGMSEAEMTEARDLLN